MAMDDAKRMIKEAVERAANAEYERAIELQLTAWENIMGAIDCVELKLGGEPLTEKEIRLGVGWTVNEILEQRREEALEA